MKNVTTLMICLIALWSCTKDGGSGAPIEGKLSYGDNVFYIKSTDYVISPKNTGAGSYTAFPDNLNIDPTTGSITISVKDRDGKATQTGLKYRINYTSTTGKKDSVFLTLAGINFQDKIYELSKNETIASPIYNANPGQPFPGGNFSQSNGKLSIDPTTGAIDLKKSIQNGLFNDDPQNSNWRVVNIRYSVNDASSASDKNNLDVVVYYYTAVQNIPSNVSTAMREHQSLLLGIDPVNIPVTNAPVDNDIKNIVSAAKPRPPCIIILGQ